MDSQQRMEKKRGNKDVFWLAPLAGLRILPVYGRIGRSEDD
jgi:hypothetical protein